MVTREQHPDIQVDSCGTAGYHIGGEPDKRSQLTALKNGINISQLRARQLRHSDFAEFNYILAMDKDNLRNMMAICPKELQSKVHLFMSFADHYPDVTEVPDPYFGGEGGFDEVFDYVVDASRGLLNTIKKEHKI